LAVPFNVITIASERVSSVTRRPAAKRGSEPSAEDSALVSPPPPCTTTTRIPTCTSTSICCTTPRNSAGSVPTSPPSFTTKVLPR
jgi:hypothetical protein